MEKVIVTSNPQMAVLGGSSKGDQMKWQQDGIWYKADHMGYEALAEVIVSRMLERSNADMYVTYDPVEIIFKNERFLGCKSKSFLQNNEELVTMEHLHRQYTGESLAQKLAGFVPVKDRIQYVVSFVEEICHINNFGSYLSEELTIDGFFLNEDRHTNNMAVISDTKRDCYRLCPYFDNGLSLLADTRMDFSVDIPIERCLEKIQAKPFSIDFDKQLDAAEELYGTKLEFYFDLKFARQELDKFSGYYDQRILDRVFELLCMQKRKYQYLFK